MNRDCTFASLPMRLVFALLLALLGEVAQAQNAVTSCDAQGIGYTQLTADGVAKKKGFAPQTVLASKPIPGGTRTRPLCPFPAEAHWNGAGSSDDAANFSCLMPKRGR